MNIGTLQTLLAELTNFKSGWKTSEFWVALSPVVVGILSVFGVGVSNDATTHFIVVAWGAVAAIYVTARTLIKSVHLGHVANLASVVHTLESDAQSVLNLVNVGNAPKTADADPTAHVQIDEPVVNTVDPVVNPAPVTPPGV